MSRSKYTFCATLKELRMEGIDVGDGGSLVFESLLANSQVRLKSLNLSLRYRSMEIPLRVKEKFPSLFLPKGFLNYSSTPDMWNKHLSPPLCDERELYDLWTMSEPTWKFSTLNSEYHNKVFIYFENQLFLEDMRLWNVPFSLESAERSYLLTFFAFHFSFFSLTIGSYFFEKKVLRIVEKNYSTLREITVSFKRARGDWDGSRVNKEVNKMLPIMQKMVSILKDRKSKMEMEMKILDNCLTMSKSKNENKNAFFLPKELVDIISSYTWDISRLSHANAQV